jgi:plastocyanin
MRVRHVGWLALAAVVAVGAGAVYAIAFREGLAADRAPNAIEAAVAPRLVALSIPATARARVNPHRTDADAWRTAAEHFGKHCSVCHGSNGRGRTPFAQTMYPPVPDLASQDVQRLTDGALFAVIEHGIRWTGMPAFASTHSDDEVWRLVSFVRHVPQEAPKPQDLFAVGQATATVSMDGTAFAPATLTVRVGDDVGFVNRDPFPHNVSSNAGGFHSGDLDPDRQWTFRATTPGTFPYECTLHPGMSGTLIVRPADHIQETR